MMLGRRDGELAALGLGLLLLTIGCGASTNTSSAAGGGGQSVGAGNGNAGASANAGVSSAGASGGASSGVGGNVSSAAGGSASGSAGNGASGSPSAGGNANTVSSCAAYSAAYCAFVQNCDALAFFGNYGSTERCSSQRQAICLDQATAAGVSLSSAQLDACSASITPTSCDAIHTACHFAGKLADGAPCAYDAQCQSTVCVMTAWGGDCGVCGPPAALGGACHQLNGCGDSATCSLGGDTRDTCVGMLPDGSACSASQYDCAHHNCANGICQPAPRTNEACSPPCHPTDDTECLNGVCQKLIWNSAGGACDSKTGVLCLGGSECNPVGGPGTCEQSPPQPPSVAADCK